MSSKPYDPSDYWGQLVSGTGDLAHVGQDALGSYNRYAYAFRLAAVRRMLSEAGILSKPFSVLEAAYGEGFYLPFWKAQGASPVAGIDISERAWRAAQTRFPDFDLRKGDLTDAASFANLGTYSLVTAIDVLYHIVDDRLWRSAVTNLLGRVGPEGSFLFTEKFPKTSPYQRFEHVRRRPMEMWSELLKEHGFEITRVRPMFVFMDDPLTCGNHRLLGHVAFAQWRVVQKALRLVRPYPRVQSVVGAVAAGLQYLPEKALVSVLRRSPNLEICLCRRVGSGS
jgi:SAM-dependent methyltransferase